MRYKHTLNLIVILVFVMALLPGGQPTRAATVSVTTSLVINDGDTSSIDNLIADPGPDGEISLREAIIAANNTPGSDTIGFELPEDDPHYNALTGVWTITPTTALPLLTGGGTRIDGYTQEGALEATDDTPATLVIEIDGQGIANNGFNITSAGNVIRGLVINRFLWNGIAIGATTATSNTIAGNYIGTTPDGLSDEGNTFAGVFIGLGAHNNLVGGDTPSDRNIISGNDLDGVNIHGENTAGNVISGNYIGTDESGTARIGNTWDGVRIYGRAHDNLVGGTSRVSGNLISANHRDGVRITGSNTMTNTVSANYIGLNAAGTVLLQNFGVGVTIQDGAQHNLVGGDSQGKRNVIVGSSSGNMCSLCIIDDGTNNNNVMGNFIGTDESGSIGLRFDVDIYGIRISNGAQNNTIGPRNLISGHSYHGVFIAGNETINNTIIGNYIGLNGYGDSAIGNQMDGILIDSAHHTTIGGLTPGEGNVISGNDELGIHVTDAHDVSIIGNTIGTTPDGTVALPNGLSGIRINQSYDIVIGGNTTEERNIISGNEGSGIVIAVSVTTVVEGNYIGVTTNGIDALGNGKNGVYIIDNSVVVTIGPGNIIAYNDEDGVHINGILTTNNTITQNSIYQNSDLGIELTDDGNYDLAAPNITAASCEGPVSGTACAGCTVEIFSDGLNEGRYYEGTTTADETTGAFSWSGSMNGPNLTATATDPDDSTSPFSTPFEVGVCNTAPTAYFTIDPLTGPLSTAFSFDASGSTDTEDDSADLEVRWDWTDDSIYDTDWDTAKTITHTYSMTDTFTVQLEVRDTGGLTDNTIRQVIVVDDFTYWQLYLPYVQR